jgi:hypothetical protein
MRLRLFVVLSLFVCLVPQVAFAGDGTETSFRAAPEGGRFHSSSATVYFSGQFSYSVGGGKARVTAQDVANTGTSATGPLRFSLYWTPNAPFPATPQFNTAQHVMGPLAAGQHFTNVDSGLVLPFTDPGNGCYYVALVLEQQVAGGAWQVEDYGNFSLRVSSGQGCLFSFTGNPLTISPGGSSTLSWSSGGASVTIDNGLGARAANGSANVTPAQSTTYTLTVNGTADSTPRTGQVTITVSQAAPTATFGANPTSVNLGQSSALTWTTTNATSVSIDNGVGSQAVNGTVNVSPTTTTIYTLTATGGGGTTTKTATVTVVQPAPTATFSAAPTTITLGSSSTLTWTTTNASSISIDNNVGAVVANGQKSVSPTATTTYTLTATGAGGTVNRQATVSVNTAGPGITFTASPDAIPVGGSSTLTWSTTNATSVSIDNGVGAKPTSGTQLVSPSRTTIYRLTAAGPSGTASADVAVVVVPPPAITFTANPTSISTAGQDVTLIWSTTDATSVSIDRIGPVTVIGTTKVKPTATTIYTLTATGVGGTATASVQVSLGGVPGARHRAARH